MEWLAARREVSVRDAVLAELAVDRRARDSEKGRGAGAVPPRLGEGFLNLLLLQGVEVLEPGLRLLEACELFEEIAVLDQVLLRDDGRGGQDRQLHDLVLELP